MDFTSIIEIVVVVAIAYFLIRFIVSPVIRLVFGIIIFLIVVTLLQRFFGFDIDQILSQFGIHLNLNKWILSFNWILGPADRYIDQIKNFLNFIWSRVLKS